MNTSRPTTTGWFASLKIITPLLALVLGAANSTQADNTWDGGGADNNWLTAANWGGDVVAVSPTLLTFAGAVRLVNTNNFPALTVFNGITFNATQIGAMTIRGNSITLGGNITSTSGGTGTKTINLPLVLSGTRTVTTVGTAAAPIGITLGGAISSSGAFGLTKVGANADVILSVANTYSGITTINSGCLRLNHATALPGGIGASGGTSALTFNGGVLGLGATGDFNRSLAAAGTVTACTFTGNGGWAAYTADRIVNLGGASATIIWQDLSTGLNAKTLIFGSLTSTKQVDFQNPLDLGTAARTVSATASAATTPEGKLSGIISGGVGGALTKGGTGDLILSAPNTYSGVTEIAAGSLVLNHATALPGGIGTSGGTSALTFNSTPVNGGTLGLGAGDFTRTLGAAGVTTAVNFTLSGGWAAYNADRVVNLNNDSHQIIWADADTGFNGQTLILGAATSTHMVDFQNLIDLGSVDRTVQVANGAGAIDGQLSGVISGSGALYHTGAGTLALSGNNTFTGNVGWSTSGQGPLSVSSAANLGAGANITIFQNDVLLTTATFATSRGIVFGGANNANQDINVASGTTFTVNGVCSTAGLLTNASWRKINSGTMVLANNANTFSNKTIILAGSLSVTSIKNVGVDSALGHPMDATLGTISLGSGANGSTALIYTGSGDTSDRVIELASTSASSTFVIDQSGTGLLKFTSGIINSNTTAKTFMLQGSTSGIGEFAGAITNPVGISLNLTKAGSGTWVLSGTTAHTGATTINAGTLVVNGTLGSGTIVYNNSILAGTGTVAAGVTNNPGGTISAGENGVGTLTLSGDLMLQGGGELLCHITNGVSTNLLVVNGTLTPSGSTAVSVPNAAGLANGDYTLISVTGTLDGSQGNFDASGSTPPGKIFTISYQANKVVLTVADSSGAALTWAGQGTDWDIATSFNWSNAVPALVKYAEGDAVTFDNSGLAQPAVVIPAAVTPLSVVVSNTTGNYSFSGSGKITGSTGLTKNGAGVLTLATTNDYAGQTVLNAGQLNLNSPEAIGSGSMTIADGTTLDNTSAAAVVNTGNNGQNWSGDFTFVGTKDLNLGSGGVALGANRNVTVSAGNLTVGGAISGGYSLKKSGAGTLTLAGANVHSGGTTNAAGTLNINSSAALGATASPFTILGGALGNSSGGAISNANNNAQKWLADFAFAGPSDLNLGSGAVPLAADREVTVNAGNLTVAGVISGAFRLTKSGTGTLTMSGSANTYSGGFTLNAGTLLAAKVTAMGAAANAAIINGGTLASADSTALTLAQPTTIGGDFTLGQASGGTGTIILSGAMNLTGVRRITVPGGVSNVISGTITNTGGLIKDGAGTLLLSAAGNPFGGGLTVSNGILRAFNATSTLTNMGFGGGLTLSGGELQMGSAAGRNYLINTIVNGNATMTPDTSTGVGFIYTFGTLAIGANTLTVQPAAAATSGNAGITFGAVMLSGAPTFLVNNNGFGATTVFTLNSTIDNGANLLTFDGSGNSTVSGIIGGGAGGLHKKGTGTLTLNGVNTYSGDTTNSAGTLTIGGTGQLGGGSYAGNIENGGTFIYSGSAAQTLSGILSGTGSLSKTAGKLTLSGANTYSGPTTNSGNGSFLRLNHVFAIPGGIGATGGSNNLVLASGAMLGLGASDLKRPLGTGAGEVQILAGGSFAAYGADRLVNFGGASAPVTWNSGSFIPAGSWLNLGADTSYGSASDKTVDFQNPIDLNGGDRTINVFNGTAAIDAIVSGGISGGGTLTKAGVGTLVLSGVNTYSGNTTNSAGTLVVNGALAGGTVVVNTGSTLAGSGTIGGTVTNYSGASIAPGAASVGILTINGNLNLASGGSLVMEITNVANADHLVVGGMSPNGTTTISLPNTASLANGDYTLIEVTGTLGGSAANFSVSSPSPLKTYAIVYQTSPNKVVLQVSDTPQTLTWSGAQNSAWDISASVNWLDTLNGNIASTYADASIVTFDDIGGTNPVVDITTTVLPVSVTVNSGSNYVFTGVGSISGTNILSKSGSGSLTISNANSFTGPVLINTGAVIVANSAALGTSAGGVNVNSNATLALEGDVTVNDALALNWDNNGLPALQNLSGTNTVTGDISANTGATQTRLNSDTGKLVLTGHITSSGNANLVLGGLFGDGEISGTISGPRLLFKSASSYGTWTISGNNDYTGGTTVSRGKLFYPGTLTNSAAFTVNNDAKLTVSGAISSGTGAWTAGSVAGSAGIININAGANIVINNVDVGTVANGNGAVNVTGGSIRTTAASGQSSFRFGNAGYASFRQSGGTVTTPYFNVGWGGIGVASITNGTFNCTTAYVLIAQNGTGVVTVATGGTLNHNFTNLFGINVANSAASSCGELNLTGGTIDNTRSSVSIGNGGRGYVNLNAGLLKTDYFTHGTGNGSACLNLNGATVQASSNTTVFLPSTVPVYVNGEFGGYAGGAVVDTAGDNTIGANLQTPVGDGVSSIPVLTSGSGYIGAPYVSITGGGGSNTTAIAEMEDDSSGNGTLKVVAIRITNPGMNYSSAPTVTLVGGAAATAATLDTATLAANTSGGLTKLGAGVLTLTGASTYTGATVVSNGTLVVNGSLISGVTVRSGAALAGGGTIGGAVTFDAGSHAVLTHGAILAIGGSLTVSGADVILNLPSNLAVGNYTLATYSGGTGSFSSTPSILTGSLASDTHATIVTGGGIVELQVALNIQPTSIAVASSSQTNGYKDSVSFTGTLPSAATGSVTFKTNGVALSVNGLSSGLATSDATILLPRGTNLITAEYVGDVNYLGSTNTIEQVVTNHPPVANGNLYSRNAAPTYKLSVADLLTNATDVIDGDTLTLVGALTSTNGITLIVSNGFVKYANTNPVDDQFSYTVSDGFGGTNSGVITLTFSNSVAVTGASSILSITGTNPKVLTAYGIVNATYVTQRATNIDQVEWNNIATNHLGASGPFTVTDSNPPPGSAYYRLMYPVPQP